MQELNAAHKDQVTLLNSKSLGCRQVGEAIQKRRSPKRFRAFRKEFQARVLSAWRGSVRKGHLAGRANAQQMFKEIILEEVHVCVDEDVYRQTWHPLL